MGDDWDPKEKLISSKMAGKFMEAIYNQNGFVLESLTKTDFDSQRIAKGVSVKVAHKIEMRMNLSMIRVLSMQILHLFFLFSLRILIMIRFLR